MSHNLHRFQICIHASNTSQSSLSLCFLNFNSGQCCAMCYYSICFSSIMACNYCIECYCRICYVGLPASFEWWKRVYMWLFATNSGGDIEVAFCSRYQDTSFTPVFNKHVLERLILENTSWIQLLWLSNYWLACIFQHANNTRQKTKYFLMACNERQTIKLFEKFTDSDSYW